MQKIRQRQRGEKRKKGERRKKMRVAVLCGYGGKSEKEMEGRV